MKNPFLSLETGKTLAGAAFIICSSSELGGTPELRNCVKVEVALLGSPSLINLMVSVDVEQH